jgi:hypothetical protein
MANWSRKTMVNEKLMEPTDKTGRGVWKITDMGRAMFAKYAGSHQD